MSDLSWTDLLQSLAIMVLALGSIWNSQAIKTLASREKRE
jgi:hypothetical protein